MFGHSSIVSVFLRNSMGSVEDIDHGIVVATTSGHAELIEFLMKEKHRLESI
jgi:hypothetical protein